MYTFAYPKERTFLHILRINWKKISTRISHITKQPDKYFVFAISRVLLMSSVFKGVLINGITLGTNAMESAINESVTWG